MTDIDEKQLNEILRKLSNKSEALKIAVESMIDDEMNNILSLIQKLWQKIEESTQEIARLQKENKDKDKETSEA